MQTTQVGFWIKGHCLRCSQQVRDAQEIHATLQRSIQARQDKDAFGELLAQCRSELWELLNDFSVSAASGDALTATNWRGCWHGTIHIYSIYSFPE